MHIFFSGIGGAGIGPLALIAHQAGYAVSGSDKQDSDYVHYLQKSGIQNITIGQTSEDIALCHQNTPIDWLVYSSAVLKEHSKHPELEFAQTHTIRTSKRDELLNTIISERHQALLAVAGTHGKTTTTAMIVWLFRQLQLPLSYSVGAKLGFGEMGNFSSDSTYFAYECDEYDKNFLQFHPKLAIISGIDYDHPDTYPTRQSYTDAFKQFLSQSFHSIMWECDAKLLGISSEACTILPDNDERLNQLHIAGHVNRKDALLVAALAHYEFGTSYDDAIAILNTFPGVSRRFEVIAPGLVSDYAHTPKKIEGALQLAHEVAGENVVVVYEGLHNTRQHFIKDDLRHLFDSAKKLYVVPSYLAREDTSLSLLSPSDIIALTSCPEKGVATDKNDELKTAIAQEIADGNLVLCLTAGGGGSLDEWLRHQFKPSQEDINE